MNIFTTSKMKFIMANIENPNSTKTATEMISTYHFKNVDGSLSVLVIIPNT